MDEKLSIYELSRNWFDFCFENPEKITPTHSAMYFFIIEHCNRLGWKDKFGLPTTMVKDAIGIRNYRTYSNTLTDLVEWGFIIMVEKSKNQYSANIIAIVKNAKAPTKALDKAMQKHLQKQSESTYQSIDSIIIQLYNYTIDQFTIDNKDALRLLNEKINPPIIIPEMPIESPKPIKLKIEDVIFQYHTLCPKFPKVEKVTESRKKKFSVRTNELKTIEDWINLFTKAGTQPFLSGDNNTGWKCSFDWIVENDTNYVKILEGKYTKKADPTKFYSDEIKPTW